MIFGAEIGEKLRIARALCKWPKFSLTSFRMVDALRRQNIHPQTVIDVGANAGQFAVAAVKLLAPSKLYAFEPIPQVWEQLKRNTASLPQVEAHSLALGEAAGERQFHLNAHSHSSSLLPLGQGHREAFPNAREVGSILIKVSTLDQFFGSLELPPPVLLKLDVQGYEAKVIAGASAMLARVRWVIAETSLRPLYDGEPLFLDLVEIMAQTGFKFLRPVGWLTEPRSSEILQLDALFERAR
ncbi:MAG TPA: FkbM family methyltransferase [Candidatus Binataceae bacterium]|nr:FkbM family methyltransferase [Candidatus Binataceae bacterium]